MRDWDAADWVGLFIFGSLGIALIIIVIGAACAVQRNDSPARAWELYIEARDREMARHETAIGGEK